tara:strand:+ start:339 stop:524 length:186 start_codon:yes stop_codon:yes gene_type:complete
MAERDEINLLLLDQLKREQKTSETQEVWLIELIEYLRTQLQKGNDAIVEENVKVLQEYLNE